MIDLSDGLATDLNHLLKASKVECNPADRIAALPVFNSD